MSETTSSSDEPTTSPVATTDKPSPQPAYMEHQPRRSRLIAVAAAVGIAAGVVFIVAVIFFSGFVLGAQSGGHRDHHGGGDRDFAEMHRGGPPPMFGGPRFDRPPFGPGGPGGQAGPGFQGPERQQPPQPPTTSSPARP